MNPSPADVQFWSPATRSRRPVVAISSCLAGNAVRYDGGDKRLQLLATLQAELELLPFCPETAAGLGVPRPPVRLVVDGAGHRAIGRDQPALDVTEPLLAAARGIARHLDTAVAVIFKSRSPSCGLGSTPAYNHSGRQTAVASGLAAATIIRALPGLLAVEECVLQTPQQCDRLVVACKLALEWRELEPPLASRWATHYAAQFCLPAASLAAAANPWHYLAREVLLPWLQG